MAFQIAASCTVDAPDTVFFAVNVPDSGAFCAPNTWWSEYTAIPAENWENAQNWENVGLSLIWDLAL
jgi:hypothetical protein